MWFTESYMSILKSLKVTALTFQFDDKNDIKGYETSILNVIPERRP